MLPALLKNHRALLIGTGLAILINVWETFSYYIVHSSWMRFGYVSVAALLPFVLLVFPVNMLLRWVNIAWSLKPWELVTIFSMAMVAAIFPTLGIAGFLISFTAAPVYYASPENQWEEYLTRYLPSWLAPSQDGNAIEWLYRGVPMGESIPWGAWIVPMFWWSALIAAVFLVCFCTAVIVRKHWVENERLAFPLAQLPLILMEGSDSPGRALPPFARNKLFWLGFAIPFGIICWNIIGYFEPAWPQIRIYKWNHIRLARGFPSILVKVNFFVICFAYFTPLNILLSVWLFQLAVTCEVGIFQRIGYTIGKPDNWCTFNAATGWQCMGGFLFLVLGGFWMTRHHLLGVIKTALGRSDGADDRDELMRYRTAIIGAILGGIFVALWFHAGGMSWRVTCTFLFFAFVTYVGVSRLVAQTGLVYLWGPVTPHSATWHLLGSATMTPNDGCMIGLSYCTGCNVERLIPTTASHATRMSDDHPSARKGFLVAMAVAAIVSMATAAIYTLYMAYTHGASNFNSFEFSRGQNWIFGVVVGKLRNPEARDWLRIMFLGIGSAVMAVFSALHYRLPWWPLHPVGLALAGTHPTRMAAFSVFLAWLFKLVVVKLGGAGLYRRSRMFFVGMMVGYILGVGLSFGVDCIWFMGKGHTIHLW